MDAAVAHSHCHFCGAQYLQGGWPRRCENCGRQTWRNPLPVAVALVPVLDTSGVAPGLLFVQRAISPRGLALPGGYVDYDDADWQAAAASGSEETSGVQVLRRGDRKLDDVVFGEHRRVAESWLTRPSAR